MTTAPTDLGPIDLGPSPADVLMSDGQVAVIRLLRNSDRDGLQALHDQVSEDAFRLRFFTVGRASGTAYVDHLFNSTPAEVICLVASLHDEIVAAATAERLGPDEAEIAFLVADDERGLGLGSLLVEHLSAHSRDSGVRHLVAEVLRENHAMLGVFRDAGFAASRTNEGGLVRVDLHTEMSSAAIAAADQREARAETRSLAPILYPRHVAVVGVRRDGSGVGHAVLTSILDGGFTGRLDIVHPRACSVEGITAHRSFTDIPGEVDLAIIAVPAAQVLAVVHDAIAAQVRGVVVISSGFGELGVEGMEIQRTLIRTARDNGIRIIGPNCLGVLVNDPAIHLNATFTHARPPCGGLAIASQSGGVGIALLDIATELGLGVHTFVSLGNKADVSGNDLLSAWRDDPQVTAAALYLESFGNAAKFARLAHEFARRKPLLAVVGGRSSGGQRAGRSHTAAAASPAVGVDALFAQAGVIACHSAEDMAETALLLATQPLPAGRRLAILSNAGGIGVLAADSADRQGLTVPTFSGDLQRSITDHVSGTVGLTNPVDLGAAGSPADLEACLNAVLSSEEVDALLVVLVNTALAPPQPLLSALADARARHPGLPLLLATMGEDHLDPENLPGITRFRTYDRALEALGRAAARRAWLMAPQDETGRPDIDRGRAARTLALSVLADQGSDHWLSAAQTKDLLAPYGLDQVGEVAEDSVHACAIAAEIGYPVALKVADPKVQHKTDRHLVRVGINSTQAMAAAIGDFARELERPQVTVLVQPMVAGVELALGVVSDPSFGPMIRIAAGGIATNILADQAFLLPPVTVRAAEEAIRGLRMWPLLDGFRGAEPGAVDSLVRCLVSLAQLSSDVPELSEVDLNPVIVTPDAAVIVDAKVRLGRNSIQRAGIPRQLRPVT